jgi:peptidoglycan hydrolase-like protein with peptidoglycan-binding domain
VVSRGNDNAEFASPANYFVIHDTSTSLPAGKTFDPAFIDTGAWDGNRLSNQPAGKTHVYITRDGKTRTDADYHTPRRATQFELRHQGFTDPLVHRGSFLHHELVQPRRGPKPAEPDAPTPGFTPAQYELLAVCYLAASVRRGRWLLPAFHCVLDLGVGDHDDPQHFDLEAWDAALTVLLAEVRGGGAPPAAPAAPAPVLTSAILRGDPVLQAVAAGTKTLQATGGPVAGVGPVQDGLNLLAADDPAFAIALGGNRGSFGPRTEKAVKAFQIAKGLPVTGRVDAATLIALDAALTDFAAGRHTPGPAEERGQREEFRTPPASAETTDGRGGSTTTGLHGTRTVTAGGVEVIEATETLTAKRDGRNLGEPRAARQTRRKENGVTRVTQTDYCWGGDRALPDAELHDHAAGLSSQDGAFEGKATFFGKGDRLDEGTGTPAFKTVQTNSSVFGVSLPRQRLIDAGLAESRGGVLRATAAGLTARVEVFFPLTSRRALLPLVDVGPAPRTRAAADLTVAATAFLQGKTEDDLRRLENITVRMRVVLA